jgi:hypothetical protein
MQQHYAVTIALVLATALSTPCAAQSRLLPADRVRILSVDGSSLTGVASELSPDSIRVSVQGEQQRWVRRAEIAYLERSAERHRKFARNFGVTIGSAAGVGAMLGAITWKECKSSGLFGCMFVPESRFDAFLMGGVAGGVISVPVGVILGLAIQYDRWEPTRLAEARRSSLIVKPVFVAGPGLSASFSF